MQAVIAKKRPPVSGITFSRLCAVSRMLILKALIWSQALPQPSLELVQKSHSTLHHWIISGPRQCYLQVWVTEPQPI